MYAAMMYEPQTSSEEWLSEYAPLVKRIAHHLKARLPANVQVDDLIQAGMMGLLEASKKFELGKGASFETFAGIRIRGAMLDEVRRNDWLPRSVHQNARRISKAVGVVEQRIGRAAKDGEIAVELGLEINEYHQLLADCKNNGLYGFEDLGLSTDGSGLTEEVEIEGPSGGIEREAFQKALSEAIDLLPEREKLVLALYYNEELNLKEIGMVIGVSESRVCQICNQATVRLRSRLRDWQ